MIFIGSMRSAGIVIIVCSLVLLGMTIYGAIDNGLDREGATQAMLTLCGVSAGGVLLGLGMMWLGKRLNQ